MPSIFRSVLWNMAGTVSLRVISLLSVPFIARMVSKDDLGTMRIFVFVCGVLVLLPGAGYARFYIILARQHRGLLGGIIVLLSLLACLVVLAVELLGADALAAFYGLPELALVLQVGCPLAVLGCVNLMLRSRFERDLAFGVVNGVQTAAAGVYALVAVVAAWLWQPTIWALLLAWCVSQVSASVFYGLAVLWRFGFPRRSAWRIHWGPIRSVLGQSTYATLDLVLSFISVGAPILVLGRIAGAEVVAAYGYAYVMIREPIRLLAGSLRGVVLPALVAREDDTERRVFAMYAARMLALFTTPCLVWVAVFAKPLARLVLGPGWDLVPPIIAWLALPIWLLTINGPLMAISSIRLKTHVAFFWTVVLLVGRLLSLWLGGQWGPVWAIALYSVVGFVMWEVWEHLACRWYGFTQRAFVANYARCLPANGLTALACLLVAYLLPGWPGVVVGAGVLAVCYPAFLYATDRAGLDAGSAILKRLLRRWRRPGVPPEGLPPEEPGDVT